MIITKTPFRMSFFGGGTDMPEFFNKYGGAVISTTFDKYCYVTVRHLPPFFDYTSEIVYSKIEQVKSVDEIEHPLVRNAFKYLDMHELRINYESDLPARSGLGTSSSFAVGLLNAFYALKSKPAPKKQLADDAIYLERVLCRENGGWQDQIAAAYGGLNRIDFKDGGYTVTPITVSYERKKILNSRLLMFFTGFSRFSSDIQKSTVSSINDKTAELKELLSLVDEAQKILTDGKKDLDDFGRLLDTGWRIKKRTGAKISTGAIDELYEKGIKAGALGGKLLGAGGGGFLVFYVRPEKRAAVIKALSNLLYVPFEFEEEGTKFLYYAPEFYDTGSRREK